MFSAGGSYHECWQAGLLAKRLWMSATGHYQTRTTGTEIRIVRIELAVEVERRGEDPARQTLATDVYLRNRGDRP